MLKKQSSAKQCLNFRQSTDQKGFKLFMAGLLLAAALHPVLAIADDSEDLSRALARLQQSDPRVLSETAKALGSLPYSESEQALVGLLANQVSNGMNTFILSAVTASLESIGTSASLEAVSSAIQQIQQMQVTDRFNQRSKEIILTNLSKAIIAMQDRNASLPAGVRPKASVAAKIQVVDGISQININGVTHIFAKDQIDKLARKGDEAAKLIAKTAIEFLTDSVLTQIAEDDEFKIFGRDKEAQETLNTLVRIKGKNPVLVGPAGAGKTTIAQRLAQIIAMELPDLDLYNDLRDAVVIETTPARISRQAKSDMSTAQASAIEDFFDAILKVEQDIKRPIIVFIDEFHTLGKAQIEAMKPYMDSKARGIRLVGATTGREFNMAFKQNEAVQRRCQLITVQEFSIAQTVEIVKATWQPQIEKNYHVTFTESAVADIVKNSLTMLPDNGRFDGSIKIMQDIAIAEVHAAKGAKGIIIDEANVNAFFQERLGYPVNPKDGHAMQAYRQELNRSLNEAVIAQDLMVESTVDMWMDLMGDSERGVRVQALLGPTGTGKSELGRALAKKVFNRPGAFLEIDANTYKTGGLALNSLIGAPNGVISSEKTSGILMDYLDDPSKGKYGGVILINEAERMPEEAWERLMEMLDVGEIAGGDGKTRRLTRHLIILTSNRVDKIVFPQGIEKLTEIEMQNYIRQFDNDKLRETYKQKSSGHEEFILPDPIIGRVDKWSLARPITAEIAKKIALKIADKMSEKLNNQFSIKTDITTDAIAQMTTASFQYGMGARPVIKFIQSQMQKVVSQALALHPAQRGEHIRIGLANNQLVASLENGMHTQLALPKQRAMDPLDDPEFAAKMKRILPALQSKVIGQPQATVAVADAVISHMSDPTANKKPATLFLVGSTGTGKTSVAKALALALFNNEDRTEIIDLGKVNFEGALNDIFGSSKRYAGSLDRPQFEEILLRNPEGGVIVFDEASNMGGDDKARKNALFKMGFYSLLDEGKWISKATGKTYDLSKFVFIFTGNDGEKIFAGLDADDLRMATYNMNKSRSQVQKILDAAGVPEAFLGRMGDVILMKPLLKTEVQKIVEGMTKEVLKSFQERGINFALSPDFSEKVGSAFFSHSQGARSVKSMMETKFRSALAGLIIEAGGTSALQGKTVHVKLSDNLSAKPYLRKNEAAREVILTLQVVDTANEISLEVNSDLTSKAIVVNKQTFRDARATAIHEAGHAIVNDPKVSGQRLSHLTIIGTGNKLGYARYETEAATSQAFTMEKLIARVATLVAGSRAQQMDGQPIDAGWSSDIQKARELISSSIIEYGLLPELHGVLYRDGRPQMTGQQMQIAAKAVEDILTKGDLRAQQILRQNWPLVRQVSAKLLQKGQLSGTEFEAMAAARETGVISILKRAGQGPRGSAVRCEALLLN